MIVRQAVLLTRFIAALRLPKLALSDIIAEPLPSQWRDRAGSSSFSFQQRESAATRPINCSYSIIIAKDRQVSVSSRLPGNMEPQLRGRFRPVLPCAAGLSHESIFVRIAPLSLTSIPVI